MAVQPDLFGEIEAAEAAEAAWRELLRGPIRPCPWDTQGGVKEGEPIETSQCPTCGGLELDDFGLWLNHGTTRQIVGRRGCWRQAYYSGPELAR